MERVEEIVIMGGAGVALLGLITGAFVLRVTHDEQIGGLSALEGSEVIALMGSTHGSTGVQWSLAHLDTEEGARWRVPLRRKPDVGESRHDVSVAGGIIAARVPQTGVLGLDRETGLERWRAGADVIDAPALTRVPFEVISGDDQDVLVWVNARLLMALDRATGEERWSWRSKAPVARWRIHDEVVAIRAGGELTLLERDDGRFMGQIPGGALCELGKNLWAIGEGGEFTVFVPSSDFRSSPPVKLRPGAGPIRAVRACGWHEQSMVLVAEVGQEGDTRDVLVKFVPSRKQLRWELELPARAAHPEDAIHAELPDHLVLLNGQPAPREPQTEEDGADASPPQVDLGLQVVDLRSGEAIVETPGALSMLRGARAWRIGSRYFVHGHGQPREHLLGFDGASGALTGALEHDRIGFAPDQVTEEAGWVFGPGLASAPTTLPWARIDPVTFEPSARGQRRWARRLFDVTDEARVALGLEPASKPSSAIAEASEAEATPTPEPAP